MPILFREIRPDELTDAVMFASMSGKTLDPESVRHDLSHAARDDGGDMIGAVVFGRDPDQQETVTVHVGTNDEPASDAEEPAAKKSDGGGELCRSLLDLTLMKMRTAGVRTTRVCADASIADPLWQQASWLDRLPEVDPRGGDGEPGRSWSHLEAGTAAALERIWDKLSLAMSELGDGDAAPPTGDTPETDAETDADPGSVAAGSADDDTP